MAAIIEACVPAVVLAGGKSKPDLQALTGQSNRALVTVNGKTLLQHVVDALHESGVCGPVSVIGDVPRCDRYDCVADGGGFVENLFAGLTPYKEAPFVVVATSDLPFLTGASVADFVRGASERAQTTGAGMVWPVVRVSTCYERYPGVKRTALKLREGEYTGGNLALVRPAFLLQHRERLAGAYAARKSPLQLARMLGLGTLGRLVLSQKVSPRLMTIAFLEERVSRLLGGPASAYLCEYPEIATDLDRPSDFEALNIRL